MLTRIDVDSEIPFYIPILGAAPKDSLMVRSITGLNPPDKDIFIGDYARDGGSYHGRRVGQRNVVMILDINPNPALGETVSGWRELLYKAFDDPLPDADSVQIVLKDDVLADRYLIGYVDKFEGDIFSSDTQVSVSFLCPDPYLRDTTPTLMEGSPGWVSVPFAYKGTAEAGFEAEVYVSDYTAMLTIQINNKTMVWDYTFTPGKVLYVNTNAGSRTCLLTDTASITPARAAMTVSDRWADLAANGLAEALIANLQITSPWIQLHSASNTFSVYGDVSTDIVGSLRTLSFTHAYWGV